MPVGTIFGMALSENREPLFGAMPRLGDATGVRSGPLAKMTWYSITAICAVWYYHAHLARSVKPERAVFGMQ